MSENTKNINNTFNKEEDASFRLTDLWHLVWDHKWWYVLALTAAVFLAAFYLYRTPSTYSCTAKVLVDESNQDATMRNLGVASAGMMKLRSFNSVENEIEAFSSVDYMQNVVERLGLQTTYTLDKKFKTVDLATNTPVKLILAGENPHTNFSFVLTPVGGNKIQISRMMIKDEPIGTTVEGNLGDTLQTALGRLAIFPTTHIDEFDSEINVSWDNALVAAKKYCAKLNVSLSGKESSVVVLKMTDTDPKRASDVISALIDVYDEVWLSNKNRAAVNTTKFINERLTVIERDLATVEEALRKYKSSNNLTDIKAISQLYLDESSHYASKAFEVRNQLSVATFIKDYLNDPAKSMSLIPANLGIANSSVDAEIKEYNDLVLQRDRLLTGSGANNPMIADLNTSIAAIRSAILNSIENLISTLDLQLARIEGQEKDILSRMSSSSGQELQLLSIERQHGITQELYKFLLQKREENELAALVNVGNTQVLQSPEASIVPVGPNKMMILLVALVMGFGLPFAFFFLKTRLDTAIKNKADLGNLSVPFLAEVPRYVRPGEKFRNFGGLRKRKDDRSLTKIIVEPGSRDMMNEAYRVLRTNMDLILGKKNDCNVLMFTSFNPAAGKTFSVMNIAASMALKDGVKVMLIDLDLRKASLSKALGIEHSGVAAYLNGKIDSYKDHTDEIAPNLFALPIGSLPPNPTELLLSDKFKEMIEEMKKDYDYIFLDCPPIDVVADASIITEVVDMTVFVMRANRLDKGVLPQIEELYQSGKYNHMTMILNCVDLQYKKYGYGRSKYGYGYGYGYGNENDKKE
jgi:capsular exopolysaccharide synthesis family protein